MRLPRSTQRSAPQWPQAPQWRAVNGAGGRNASCSPLQRLVAPFYTISLEMPNNSEPNHIAETRGTAALSRRSRRGFGLLVGVGRGREAVRAAELDAAHRLA